VAELDAYRKQQRQINAEYRKKRQLEKEQKIMSLTLKEEAKSYEICPQGTYLARCYRIIDMGTQKVEYQGEIKHQPKILISWELPEELNSEGQPYTIQKRYTASLFKQSALRKDLESWRGQPFTDEELQAFNVAKLLGKYCLVTVIHKTKGDRTYEEMSTIMKPIKGTSQPPGVNPCVFLDLAPDAYIASVFNELNDKLKEKIAASPEWKEINQHGTLSGADIPDDADIVI
jgi:hypothetical protein